MKLLVSNLLKKISEDISAGIDKDEYLEHVEREKDTSKGTGVSPQEDKDKKVVKPTKEKEKCYVSSPKIKPPRRQPSFKNKWDSNDTRREYQQNYRLENGNK